MLFSLCSSNSCVFLFFDHLILGLFVEHKKAIFYKFLTLIAARDGIYLEEAQSTRLLPLAFLARAAV